LRPGEARAINPDRLQKRNRNQFSYRLPAIGNIVTGIGEISDGGVRSRGLTIATQPDAQVVAPADGRIAFAGPYEGYGQILIIEHDAGWTSLLTSLHMISARVGDRVGQGAPVGRAGKREPTVTIELRRSGQPVDIVQLIAG